MDELGERSSKTAKVMTLIEETAALRSKRKGRIMDELRERLPMDKVVAVTIRSDRADCSDATIQLSLQETDDRIPREISLTAMHGASLPVRTLPRKHCGKFPVDRSQRDGPDSGVRAPQDQEIVVRPRLIPANRRTGEPKSTTM